MWLCSLRFRQRIKHVFCRSDLHLRQQDVFPHVGHDQNTEFLVALKWVKPLSQAILKTSSVTVPC